MHCDVKHCCILLAAQGESAPTSVAEFEALVLSSGDSSFVWVKYMAFLVSLGDVEKARALGHRALGVINYRWEVGAFLDGLGLKRIRSFMSRAATFPFLKPIPPSPHRSN